jgi:acylphosphatase
MSKSIQEKFGIHCFISGRVQGVWFRASTQEQAVNLGLTGWTRNLSDGRVEVKAFGEKEQLVTLHNWLKVGPELAEVTEVIFEEVPFESHGRFAVK